ncbi:TPA: AAA family ATPase [Enterobacter hormaechei subsp. xiangfangensis]|nr:AAA family ATPase [Enterobacter hormaechei subsp. xiangfangensis]
MGKYHNDQPIRGGSNDPDLLNRLDFANHLANALLLDHDDSCLTISLEGEWGYGKTSVINLVKGALNEKEQLPIIVEYNPWLAGNSGSLIQDFLIQLSSRLRISNHSENARKAAQELIIYSKLFSVAKLIPGMEPWASIIEKVFSGLGDINKEISDLDKLDLMAQKKKVSVALEKIKTPVVVIIDDIDRLTPAETFQVLRLVKAVADFSGTSFLLAFDANYLASVLNKNNIVNSTEYINKIIQLRVPLPLISERGMNELVNVELERLSNKNLTDQFEGDQERLSWIYYKYFTKLIKNPRDLKRLFNHLRFVLLQIEGQVCFSDLFSLSLLATKSESIYNHIKNNPEAYIGYHLSKNNVMLNKAADVVASFNDIRNELISSHGGDKKEILHNLLGEIFPLIKSGNSPYRSASNADANGRVSSPQRLYIALHYNTPIEYLSDQQIQEFISGLIDRKDFLDNVLSNDAEDRFFEMMHIYADLCKDKSYEVLTHIFDAFLASEKIKKSLLSNLEFFSTDMYTKINWLVFEIISKSKAKYEIIKRIVEREENTPFSGDILRDIRSQYKEQNNDNFWLNTSQLNEIELIFQDVAISALSNKRFLNNNLEPHIFYALKASSKDKASAFISNLFGTSEGVIRISELIGESGRDSTNGPYVQIKDNDFTDFINIKILRAEVEKLDIEHYSKRTQAILKSIMDGRKYYLRDSAND